jgi:hypothetical protein
MGKAEEERQTAYKPYILQPRPYEKIVDKAMLNYYITLFLFQYRVIINADSD